MAPTWAGPGLFHSDNTNKLMLLLCDTGSPSAPPISSAGVHDDGLCGDAGPGDESHATHDREISRLRGNYVKKIRHAMQFREQ